MTVTKNDLVNSVAMEMDISERSARSLVDAVLDKITASVAKGDDVSITGFGKFYKAEAAERTTFGHTTPAHGVPKFKPGTTFKNLVK